MASERNLRPDSRPASAGLLALLCDESGSIRRSRISGLAMLVAALATVVLVIARSASATQITTPANYTTNADTAANGSAPAWSANLSIVIAEQVKTDFPNAAGKTVILDAPSGWAFDTAAGTTATGTMAPSAGDFTSVTLTSVTATQITLTVSTNNTNKVDTLTISNVKVRPTAAYPVTSGSISWDASSTFAINGAAGLNYGTLTENPAAASALAVTTQPSGATAGAAFTTQPAVAIQDQYGNTVTSDTSTVTVALNAGTGPLQGTLTTAAVAGVATFTNLRIDDASDAKTLRFTDGALTAVNANSFSVTPAAANRLVVTTQPAGATAGSAFTTQPVVKIEDQYNNVVTSDTSTVTVALNAGTGPLQGTLTKAAVAGVATFTNLRLDDASDAKTLRFTDGALTLADANSLTVTPAAANKLVVTTQPAGATAGSPFTTQPVVKIEDQYNNVVTSDTSTVTVALNAGTGPLQGTLTKAAVAGVATFTNLRIDDASNAKTLRFTDGALTAANANSFTVTPAAANKLAVTTQPAGATAGAAFTTQPVVTVQDQFGNTVTSDTSTVTVALNAGTGPLQGTLTKAAVAGVTTFTNLRLDDASDAKTLRFTDGALTLADANSFTVTPAAANKLVVTTQPAGATAGANLTTQPVVKIEDQFNNVVTSDTSTVTVALNAGTGPLQGTLTRAAVAGVATFTNLRIDDASNAKTVRFTDGALTLADANSFTVTPGALAGFAFALVGPQTNGIGFSGANTLTAQDSFGNTVTSFSAFGDNVTIAANGALSTGSISGLSGVNKLTLNADFVNGVASLTTLGLTYTGVSGSGTFTATSASGKTGTSGSISVNAGAATHLGLTGTPASVTAGNTGSVTVTALDASNNTAPGYAGTVQFTSSDGQAVLPANYTFVGGDNGAHTFSNAYTLKSAASQTVTATDTVTGSINGTSSAITVNPAAASTLSVSAGAIQTAGSSFTTTVTAKDAYDNTATGYTGTVHFTSNDGQAVLPANYAFLAGDNGTKNFTVTLKTAGSRNVVATDTVTGSITGTTGPTVSAAAASQLAVTTQPGSATAGSTFGTQPMVTVQDAYGNTITGDSSNVTVSLGSGTGPLQGTVTVAASGGVATFTNLRIDKSGAKILHFDDGALTAVDANAFSVSPTSASALALTTQPSGATAGSAFGGQPVVAVQDAFGNTVTSDGSTVTAALQTGTGSLAGTVTAVASSGVAAFTNLRIDTSGAKTLRFSDGALSTIDSGSFTVSAAAAATLQVSAGTTQTAGAPFDVTVTARDAFNNVATGYLGTVNFTSSDGSAVLPSNYAFVGGDSGTHTFSAATTLKQAGTQNVIATDTLTGSITGTQNGIAVSPAAANKLAVTTQPGGATAGANLATQPVVTVQDQYGNTITGDSSSVTVSLGAGSGSLQGTLTKAAVNGVATFTNLRIDNAADAKTLHFVDGALTATDATAFNVTSAAANKLAVTTQPSGATAGATFTTQPVVTVQDQFGNTITDDSSSVTVSLGAGSGSLQGTLTKAAVNGVASFTNLRIDNAADAKTLRFTDGGLTLADANSFTVTPAAANKLAVTTQPAGATAGANLTTQPVVTVQDQFGNTVTSDSSTVTVDLQTGSGSLQGILTKAAVNGVASFTNLRIDNAADAKTLRFTDGGLTLADANSFTVTPAAANKLTVTTQPAGATAGANLTTQPVVKIEDQFNNVVTGDSSTVTVNLQAGSGPLQGTLSKAAVNGVATFTNLRIDDASNAKTLRFTDGALTLADASSFTVTPAGADHLTVTNAPASVTAGSAAAVRVTALDQFGNTAPTYTGTVVFSSDDPAASLPSNYTFAGADNGVHDFSGAATVTLKTVGSRHVTVTDSALASPSASSAGIGVNHAAADHFAWSGVPATTVAGSSFTATLTLLDLYGNTATGYTGTVDFASTDGQAVLPADYTYVAGDGGAHTFSFTLKTVAGGAKTITADDASLPVPNRSLATGGISVTATSALTFTIADGGAGSATAGAADQLTITAKDQFGNVADGYTGDHDLTFNGASVSPNGTAPTVSDKTGAPVAFGGATTITFANGVSSAGGSMTLTKAVGQTITATASSPSVTTPSGLALSVAADSATTFALADAQSGSVNAGQSDQLTITARDDYGNTATGYTGDHDLTFAGGQAAPDSTAATVTSKTGSATAFGGATTITFTGGVSSAGGLMVLPKAGAQSISASAGSVTTPSALAVAVSPTSAQNLTVSNAPASVTAGTTAPVRVTALDAFGNTATGYTGTIAFSSDDPAASLPSNYTFAGADSGVHDFSGTATVTLKSAGSRHVTVIDSALPVTSASSAAIAVNAAAADHFAWAGTPGSATAGSAFTLTLRVDDLYGNAATGYTSTVVFSSTDGQAVVPGNYAFNGGDAGVHTFANGFTLKTTGSETITASDGSLPPLATSGITVSPGAASKLVVRTQPAGATAGSAFSTQPAVEVQDAYGNIVTGDSSSVTASIVGGGTLTGSATVAASSGVATFTNLRIDAAGNTQLRFADGGLTPVNSSSFAVAPAAAASLQVGAGTSQTAGTAFGATVTARDAYGNVATGYTGTVGFASSDGSAVLPANYTFVAGDNGTHSFAGAMTLKQAGTQNLIATDTVTGSITGAQNGIGVAPAAAAKLELTGSVASLASGAGRAYTATVEDAYGNPIVADNTTSVTIAPTAGPGSLTGGGSATVSSGVTSRTLTGVVAGSVTVTASAGGLTPSALTFTVVPGAAAKLALADSGALTSGGTRTLTATVQDAAGNTVTGDTSGVTFTRSAGPGTATGLPATISAVNGVATLDVTNQVQGSITVDAADGALTQASAGWTIVTGAAAKLALAESGSSASGATHTLTATVQDAAGNTVTSDTSSVSFAQSSGAGTAGGFGSANAVNGVASLDVTNVLAGPITATATDGALTQASAGWTVVHGSAAKLVVSGATGTLASGSNRAATATVEDAAGNVLTDDNSTAVDWAQTGGSGAVSGLGVTTASGGAAPATATGTTAGPVTITASSGSLTSDTISFTVVAGPVDATQSSVSASPASALADGVESSTLSVTLRDASGNTISGTNVAPTQGVGGSIIAPANVSTNGSGVATFTVTDTTPESVTYYVAGVTQTAAVTFTTGALDHLVLSPAGASITAGSSQGYTAEGFDASDNDLGDFTASTVFSIAPNGSCTGASCSTSISGAHTVTGTNAGKTGQTTLTVSAGAASLNASTFTGAPASVVANGSSTSTVTLHLKDTLGNDLGAPDGSTIAFTTDLGSVGAAADNGDGTYTASFTSGTAAGTAHLSATRNGFAFAQSFAVALTPGPVSAGVSTASAAPAAVVADGTTTSTVTVRLKDANGNVVAGKSVSLGQGAGSSTIAPASQATNAAGVATFTVKSATAESVTYTATDTTDALTLTQRPGVTFTPDAVSAAQSSVAAAPSNVVADDTATATVTVTLKDANGNRVAGKTVSLGQGGGSSTISPANQVTNGSGQAVFSVKDGVAETVVYTATDTTDSTVVAQTASVDFVAGAPSLTNSTIAAAPATIVADGSSTATVTVRLKDALNNDLAGSGGTVALATTRGTLSAVTDNGDGTYTATLTSSTAAGLATVSGTLNGSGLAATATVDTVAGPIAHFAVAAGSPQTAGTAFNVTVTAQDANDNTVKSYAGTVQLTSNDASATLPADYTFVGADNGAHTFSVTLRGAGSRTITATQGSNTGTSGAIAVGAAGVDAGVSTVAASPGNVTADGTQATVTVTLKDQYGNAVSGKSVSLTAGAGSSTIQTTPLTTNSSGAAAFDVSNLVAETVIYSAVDTSDSTSIAQTASVTFDAGPLDHVAIAPSSSTIVAGSSETYAVRAFDVHNNLIAVVTGSASLGIVPAPSGTSCTGATCTSSTIGSYTVTASYGGKSANATLTVNPAGASLAQSAITTDDGSLQVGPSSTTLVHVTLKDQFGNPVGASGGPVNLAASAGSLSAVTDNLDGTYTATLTAPNLTGVASVTGNLGGPASPFASSASVTFTPGPATQLTLAPSTTSTVAGNAFTVDLTALDQYGNVDTNYADSVHFTSTDGSATLPSNTTLPGGGKTVSVTLNSAGLQTVTATDTTAGAVNGSTPSITVAAGGVSAAQSTVSASPNAVVHDGSTSSTITVTLKDGSGNPVAGKAVTLDQGSGSSSITTVNGTSDAAGQATFTVTDTTVEPVTYTATGDGVTLGQTAVVTFTNGALDHIVLTPATATVSAGATQAYHVEGYDASNVDLGDLTGSSTITLDGIACGGNTCGSTAAGTHTITASNSGKTDTATLTVTAASASTATSTVSAPASTQVSNPGGGVTVTVTLKDAFGNPLTTGGDAITIQSSLGTVGTVSDNGNGTYTAPLSSTVTGIASLTAKIGASTIAGSSTVSFDPGPAAVLGLTGSGSTTAGDPITVTATLRDQFGNVATGYTGTLTFTSSDGQAALPADYTFNAGDAGTRSFSVTLKTAGAQTVHAADGPIAATTPGITVSPSSVSAATSGLSVSPAGGVPADGTSTATVTATLQDQYGNALQGKSVQILLGGSAVPSSTFATTNASGQATFMVSDATVENVTISAVDVTDGFGLSGPSVDFLAGSAESIQVSPATQTITAGSSQTYTVKAYDHWNHYLGNVATSSAITVDGSPCPSAVCAPTTAGSHSVLVDYLGITDGPLNLTVVHGALTGIAVSGPAGTVGIGASSVFTSTGHDAQGNSWNDNASTTFTIAPDGTCTGDTCQPATAGDHTVTGTDGAFSDSTTLHVTSSGGGSGVDPGLSTITSSAGTVPPDGTAATIIVTLRDGTGTAVSGKTVTLHTSPAGKPGDGDTQSTNASGKATFTVSDTTATPPETVTYSADDTTDSVSLSSTASITYSSGGSGPGPTDPARSSVVAAPASVVADGAAQATITVTLADASGVALSGKDVTVTGGSAVVSPHATTDASGQAAFTATDLTAEAVTFSATVAGDGVALSSNSVTFTAPVVSDTTPPSAVTATAADGGTSITISFDEPLGGSVSDSNFTVAGTASGNDHVNGASVTTGGTTVTVTVDNPLDTTDTYSVTYNGATLTDQATTPNAAAAFTLSVTVGSGSPPPPPSSGSTAPPIVKPPPPPPAPAVFGGVTPANGLRLFFLDTIVLRATTVAHWSNVTVTPDGGAAQSFPDSDTATYTIPYTPPGAGGYTIHATMTDPRYDAFTPVDVSSHFDYGPAPPPPPPPPAPPTTGNGNAGPSQHGGVVTADGGGHVEWDGGTFSDAVTVDVRPVTDGVGGANGGRAVEVTALRASDSSQVHSLAGVLDVHFANARVDAVPATSEDNVVWSPLPALTSHALPEGVAAGFFRDDSNTVHILTTHLTYFGLLRAPASKLAFRVVSSVRFALGKQTTVAARLQSTRAARVTATLFGPAGKRLTTWKLDIKAGTSIAKLRWPSKVRTTGAYTITFGANAQGQAVARAIRLQVVKPDAPPRKGSVSVVISGPSVSGLGAGLTGVHVLQTTGEDTFAAAGTPGSNVTVIVIDIDQYGLATLRDLHTLFPEVRIVAVSDNPKTLGRAIAAGATVALPSSTPSEQLAALIGKLAMQAR